MHGVVLLNSAWIIYIRLILQIKNVINGPRVLELIIPEIRHIFGYLQKPMWIILSFIHGGRSLENKPTHVTVNSHNPSFHSRRNTNVSYRIQEFPKFPQNRHLIIRWKWLKLTFQFQFKYFRSKIYRHEK